MTTSKKPVTTPRPITEALEDAKNIHRKLAMVAPGDPEYAMALQLEPIAARVVKLLDEIDGRTPSQEPSVKKRGKA